MAVAPRSTSLVGVVAMAHLGMATVPVLGNMKVAPELEEQREVAIEELEEVRISVESLAARNHAPHAVVLIGWVTRAVVI